MRIIEGSLERLLQEKDKFSVVIDFAIIMVSSSSNFYIECIYLKPYLNLDFIMSAIFENNTNRRALYIFSCFSLFNFVFWFVLFNAYYLMRPKDLAI